MKRYAFFVYGVAGHALFLLTYAYMAGFFGNFLVPKSIDSQASDPLATAIIINTLLIAAFALPHSIMARPAFKRWWTQFVPHPIERSTYVFVSSALFILLMWQWQPMGGIIWQVDDQIARALLHALFAVGWLMVPLVTMLINHFDLMGTRQVWLYLKGKPYTNLPFNVPLIYKRVRHPLYIGWLIAFWATPTMTVGHLIMAALFTVYILVAIPIEERDLITYFPNAYAEYRRRVPALIPRPGTGVTHVADLNRTPDLQST